MARMNIYGFIYLHIYIQISMYLHTGYAYMDVYMDGFIRLSYMI